MNSFNSINWNISNLPLFNNSNHTSINDVLSRYHFIDISQSRSYYSEYNYNPSLIINIDKIIKVTIPSHPEVITYIRQLKLYYYLTDNNNNIIPLKGILKIERYTNNEWVMISVSNIEWIFVDNNDLNDRYNKLLFTPLEIEPTETQNGINIYEIKIHFEPEIPKSKSIKIYTKGSDKQINANIETFYPAMSIYLTTSPLDQNTSNNLLLEIINTLLGIADKSGIYDNTEYNGAPQKIISVLPHLRNINNSDFQSLLQKLDSIIGKHDQSDDFISWANKTNFEELSRLRNENHHLKQQLSNLTFNK